MSQTLIPIPSGDSADVTQADVMEADVMQADGTQAAVEAAHLLQQGVARANEAIAMLQRGAQQLRERLGQLQATNALLETQNRQLQSESARLIHENARVSEENTRLQAQNAQLMENQARFEAQLAALGAELERERAHNRELTRLVENLHFDLLAENVPMLALKMAMQLTGAEVGLFTEADGDDILARVGFEELENFLEEAVYDYSRRTAQSEEPTVENDAKQLPDGAGLVNLAALPFAIKGQMSGVLLLANKRNGSFTDAECQILLSIGQHAGLAMENAKLHRQLLEAYTSTVAVLADAIEAKDAYTRGHCEDVSRVSVEVARRLGVVDGALEAVRYAALLHDVGKIGIPDGILLKPGKLMPEEFSIIQKHASIGRDLINRVPSLAHIGEAILHHHERFDGSGYPDGLDGENIPLASRIIGAVDAFDAMTSPRPYREPVASSEAFEEMRRCAGTQFDPRIVAMVTEVLVEAEVEKERIP